MDTVPAWQHRKDVEYLRGAGQKVAHALQSQMRDSGSGTYPRVARLTDKQGYDRVFKTRLVFRTNSLLIRVSATRETALENPTSRLGIVVSRKYGPAVARNRFRRVIREAFRIHKNQFRFPMENKRGKAPESKRVIASPVDVVILPRGTAKETGPLSYGDIVRELQPYLA